MKVACAFVVLAFVAVVASTSSAQNYQFSPKSGAPSSEAPKLVSTPSPVPVQHLASSGLDTIRPYPAQSYQLSSEYSSPFARSAFGPKAAAAASPYSGAYQPYQQYNFGPYQQQYYPGSAYSAASGSYPTPYSSQSAGASYPTPYSAYGQYAAQPYSSGSSYPSYPSAYPAYPSAYPSYYGQFAAPSASPYSSQFASSTATPYSAQPSAYQQQQMRSSFYNSAVDGQQFPSQQFPSQQYYPSVYQNSPAVSADSTKVSSDMK